MESASPPKPVSLCPSACTLPNQARLEEYKALLAHEHADVGWLYIVRHDSWPENVYKFGITQRKLTERVQQYNVVYPTDVVLVRAWLCLGFKEVESHMVAMLAPWRVKRRREMVCAPLELLLHTVQCWTQDDPEAARLARARAVLAPPAGAPLRVCRLKPHACASVCVFLAPRANASEEPAEPFEVPEAAPQPQPPVGVAAKRAAPAETAAESAAEAESGRRCKGARVEQRERERGDKEKDADKSAEAATGGECYYWNNRHFNGLLRGGKPVCGVCGAAFTNVSNLSRHLRQRHPHAYKPGRRGRPRRALESVKLRFRAAGAVCL